MDCVAFKNKQLQQHFIPMQSVSIPKHIKLADPNFNVSANVNMLIGAESFWRLICAGQIKQAKNQPTLQKTHFGWIISGKTSWMNWENAKALPSFYLSHHAVQNETSSTTKFRVVFDGSCKTTTRLLLNDIENRDTPLQENLFSILVRFRTFKIALTIDIAKMYRQILIDSTQTPLQRIFWRESPDEPIKTFELLTVTYGTSSASFLAIRALRKLADSTDCYPMASQIALRDF
ncbi:PREDICTED: uncharacterized protein LOC105154245 [Acromyrmex echinatior]|uniref:uncharacterized protein LOC105154245 n=1 Tax=Acromyrmex echinatior TaxID=103372 RepID=UPI000580E22F|nr:PREDICTED: uncharacterized protein LOC105154245 [Acromyrmex echinatior]